MNGSEDSTNPDECPESSATLLNALYEELRALAGAMTRRLPPGQTLQPTALLHEAYLRLVSGKNSVWESRRHFFGSAANAMRHVVVDQARHKSRQKRGGNAQRIELVEGLVWVEPQAESLLALEEALQQMERDEPQLAEIVLLRYYTGLSIEETAEVVGRSVSTLTRQWRRARAWLADRIEGETLVEPPGALTSLPSKPNSSNE